MAAYLTVDDAPSESLDEKRRLLERRGVSALFFCEGRRLADHPDAAERAAAAGFHLGNHTYSHPHATGLSVPAFEREVAATERLIERRYDRAGVDRPARVFRFPYGDVGDERAAAFQQVLQAWGFRPPGDDDGEAGDRRDDDAARVDWPWTLDVEDWTADGVPELRRRVDAVTAESGGDPNIVLFHDAGNGPEAFAAFVDRLLDRGFDLRDPIELLR